MLVLLTGVGGFVGTALLKQLASLSGVSVRGSGRATVCACLNDYHMVDMAPDTNWEGIVSDIDVVIHCAARVHIMDDQSSDPLAAFREVNVAGTLNLAQQCAGAGVRRFIFVSSIKVNGERTTPERRFMADDVAAPEDPYGISKMEAEQGLRKIAEETCMEVVIIRPPLVYGPGVKGNFRTLLKLTKLRFPLPFGSIQNQRSMVYVGNLVDLLIRCIDSPSAANKTFLISDGEDLSTSGLLRLLRKQMGLPAWLLPVPVGLFEWVGRLTGKSALVDRLCGSLQVDSSKVRKELGWAPPFTVEQGLAVTVDDYLK